MQPKILVALGAALLSVLAPHAARAVQVFACEPEWGALVQELAGDRAKVYVATTAQQDPHHIEARPSLISRARSADLLVCTGAELEVGWLPLLLRQSGNPRIQAGQPGNFLAATQVLLRERPAVVDRSMGDVHAAGNPHLHLDPRNLLPVAAALVQRLVQIDPAGSAEYAARAADFATRWRAAMADWEGRAAPLKGVRVVTHHPDLNYLLAWLGMELAGTLEPKPGIPPAPRDLAWLLGELTAQPARLVLRTPYEDARPSEWLAEHASIPALELPYSVGGDPQAQDLFGLFNVTLNRLLEGVAHAAP